MARHRLLLMAGSLAIAIAATAAACGARSAREEALRDLAVQIEQVRTGTLLHASHVAAADSLEQIVRDEQWHRADMDGHAAGMLDDLATIEDACGVLDPGPGLAAMRDMVGVLDSECAMHYGAMVSISTLAGARSEEDRHQAAMRSLLDDMVLVRDGMALGGDCMEHEREGVR